MCPIKEETKDNVVRNIFDNIKHFSDIANNIFTSLKYISFNNDNIIVHVGAFDNIELHKFEAEINISYIIVSIDSDGAIQLVVPFAQL